ncbi:hypothetical protein QA601_01225 [Chitinispirillales bacterium ANBcel5]|uniref:hypothetical protein n=1 Tax=Cellulosispirillum alkaliphilum TaxID=3039283 RepID=UPI002A56F3C5|nr:hypothetical protein [Chitinispirillales bacterium ANBcel5]
MDNYCAECGKPLYIWNNYGIDGRWLCFECSTNKQKDYTEKKTILWFDNPKDLEEIKNQCAKCGKKLGILDNYGTDTRWLCFDCNDIDEVERYQGKAGHKIGEVGVVCTSCGFEGFVRPRYRWDGFVKFNCPSCGMPDKNRLAEGVKGFLWLVIYIAVILILVIPPQIFYIIPVIVILFALLPILEDKKIGKKMEGIKTKQ